MVCSLRPSRRPGVRRGVSLIEGMVASVVLLIGLLGVFQGIVVASQQNSMANLASRGAGIAAQMRVALDVAGPERVLGLPLGSNGLLTAARCTPSAEVRALAGGLEDLSAPDNAWKVACIFDLDASESSLPLDKRLLAGYPDADAKRFRRVLVWVSPRYDPSTVRVEQLAVVVSWNEMGKRRFVRQFFSFYDAGESGNGTHVEI